MDNPVIKSIDSPAFRNRLPKSFVDSGYMEPFVEFVDNHAEAQVMICLLSCTDVMAAQLEQLKAAELDLGLMKIALDQTKERLAHAEAALEASEARNSKESGTAFAARMLKDPKFVKEVTDDFIANRSIEIKINSALSAGHLIGKLPDAEYERPRDVHDTVGLLLSFTAWFHEGGVDFREFNEYGVARASWNAAVAVLRDAYPEKSVVLKHELIQNWIDLLFDNERTKGDRMQSLASTLQLLINGKIPAPFVIREQKFDTEELKKVLNGEDNEHH